MELWELKRIQGRLKNDIVYIRFLYICTNNLFASSMLTNASLAIEIGILLPRKEHLSFEL